LFATKRRQKNTVMPVAPGGFQGAIFGNNLGNLSHGSRFFEMVNAGNLRVIDSTSTKINLANLKSERIDCYVNDRRAIAFEARNSQLKLSDFVEMVVVSNEIGFIGYNGRLGTLPYRGAFIREFNATHGVG